MNGTVSKSVRGIHAASARVERTYNEPAVAVFRAVCDCGYKSRWTHLRAQAVDKSIRHRAVKPLARPLPQNGVDRCECGVKYWYYDRCADCGAKYRG